MRSGILSTIDPRAKLVAFLAVQALLFAPAVQPLEIRLATLALLMLPLLLLAGGAGRLWLRLLSLSAPLIVLLVFSAFLPTGGGEASWGGIGLRIAAKSALVLLALAIFLLAEEPGKLLQALRQIGLPRNAVVVIVLGLRFASQWRLELESVHRAWTGRNIASLPRLRRARQLGKALPIFFERFLDSAVHVHEAMISRNFSGTLPGQRRLAFSGRDAAFLALTALAVALIANL